jgi:hypothetical protein
MISFTRMYTSSIGCLSTPKYVDFFVLLVVSSFADAVAHLSIGIK